MSIQKKTRSTPARPRPAKAAKAPALPSIGKVPPPADVPLGLRDRKKRETRLAISKVATSLFIERGFDNVTVAEVAAAANVSVNTIFNYFTTKEELFFDRGEEVGSVPARMVRARRPGESVVEALERGLREDAGFVLYASDRVRPFSATIEASLALKAKERALFDASEALLAEAIREEARAKPDDPMPAIIAALVTALEWTLLQQSRARLLRGEPEAKIHAWLARTFTRGFEVIRAGAGEYGRRST